MNLNHTYASQGKSLYSATSGVDICSLEFPNLAPHCDLFAAIVPCSLNLDQLFKIPLQDPCLKEKTLSDCTKIKQKQMRKDTVAQTGVLKDANVKRHCHTH